MLVTVGGSVASGKSTLAKNLAKKLGFAHVSAGSFLRQMADERGMSILEFSKLAESFPEIDKEIDERQRTAAKAAGDAVVDGRLSAYFLKPDLALWLVAPAEVRAKRLLSRGEKYKNVSEARAAMEAREASERKRYSAFYSIDLGDLSVYDLVINTGRLDIPAMTSVAYAAVEGMRRK
ncbi:Putative adenylate kinase [uncultured archaeon]|nr:Putative adenylate kinase [uncultured archaeon]